MINKSTVIIGGGFSGIACALELLKGGAKDVTIIEGEERLGGLAYYFTHEGRRIHTGYHQILESDTPLVNLIRELGLYERVEWKKLKNKVFVDGSIYDLLNPLDFARFPLGVGDKVRFAAFMARCYAKGSWADLEDVSADEWIASIAGRRVLDELFAPLFDIKFGLPPSQVSAAWVGSRLGAREASCRFGCVPGHEWTSVITEAAQRELEKRNCRILLKTRVEHISRSSGRVDGVRCGGETIPCDTVVSSVSPVILSRLVQLGDPILDSITYIDSLSTIVSVPHVKQDFYWLMCLRPRFLAGGLFNLSNLNPTLGAPGEIILNFFTNVDHGSAALKRPDEELLADYAKSYSAIYGEALKVNWFKVNRIPFVSAKYVKGYRNPAVRTSVEGLYLCGNYMSYPSVTSTGTAISTGLAAARAVTDDQRKRGNRHELTEVMSGGAV
jgi:protoporphyrinogen oxidase